MAVNLYGGYNGATIFAVVNNRLQPLLKDGLPVKATRGQYIAKGSIAAQNLPLVSSPYLPLPIYLLDVNTTPRRAVLVSDVSLSATPSPPAPSNPTQLVKELVEQDNRNTAQWQSLVTAQKTMKAGGVTIPTNITAELQKVADNINSRKAMLARIPEANKLFKTPDNPSVFERFYTGATNYLKSVFGISGPFDDMSTGQWALVYLGMAVFPPASLLYLAQRIEEWKRNFGIALEDGKRLDNIAKLLKRLEEEQDAATRERIRQRIMQEVVEHGADSAGRGYERGEEESKGFLGELGDLGKIALLGFGLYLIAPAVKKEAAAYKPRRR